MNKVVSAICAMALTFSLLVSTPVISSASESGDTAIEVANSLAAGVSLSGSSELSVGAPMRQGCWG